MATFYSWIVVSEYSAPDEKLDAQIRAANHYDQQLYEFAGKLLDARNIACGK